MKKLLLILGIVIIIACVLSLVLALWNLYAYYNVLDGSQELYHRLHQRMTAFFMAGGILAVIGAACMIIRSKI